MSALPQKLKAKMQEKSLSAHALEKLAKLKPSVVQNILQGKSKNPTLHTLTAITQVLNCRIEELVDNPKLTKKESLAWDATLYQEAIQVANELFTAKQLQPNKEQMLNYVDEIYSYTLKTEKKTIDRHFAEWLIDKQFLA